jgi:thioredoxin-like negative regulator of GroEL
MTTLSAAVVLQAAIIATGADDYAAAHHAVTETGKPMVVMVGAQWCPACQRMKGAIMPQVRKRGLLRKVAYAFVDLDRDRELAQQLTGGGAIPQLIMYRKTRRGWLRKVLIGCQSVQTVETFIDEGVALNEAEQHPAGQKAQPASQAHDSGKSQPQPDRSASKGAANRDSQPG